MTATCLELRQVSKRFGETEILRGVDLLVNKGECLALIGPNGAGKSSLFNLISGRIPVTAGEVRLNGEIISGLPPFEINRRGLARSFQITNLFPRLSVQDNLRCAVLWSLGYRYSFWHRLNRLKDVHRRVDYLLEEIGLASRRDVKAAALSYAEQRALEIGVTIAGDADVLLLDEPTAGMSRSEADEAMALIRKLVAGKTLLMIEHDMSVVFGLADRIAVLDQGSVLACDSPERIRADARVRAAYLGIDAAMES